MRSKRRLIYSVFFFAMTALAFWFTAPPAFAGLNYAKTTVTPAGQVIAAGFAVNDRGQVAWVGMWPESISSSFTVTVRIPR